MKSLQDRYSFHENENGNKEIHSDIHLLDPKNEYDYPEFEKMIGYAISYIQKVTGKENVSISGKSRSFTVTIGKEKVLVTKTLLQIFCFLCRFEGNIINRSIIIERGLSTERKVRDITNGNIDINIGDWNRRILHISELLIEGSRNNKYGLKKIGGYFVGDLEEKTLYEDEKSGRSILDIGGRIIIKSREGDIFLSSTESKILVYLMQKSGNVCSYETLIMFTTKRGSSETSKQMKLINTHISGIKKKLRSLDGVMKIETITGEGFTLIIHNTEARKSIQKSIKAKVHRAVTGI